MTIRFSQPKKNAMTRRKAPRDPVYAVCARPDCGQQFIVHRPWQRFCSKQCRERVQHAQMRADARSHRAALEAKR
jgi:hypothetical protein